MLYQMKSKIRQLKKIIGPKNFSDKYEGKINLLRAFAISSNVAAIRLSDIVGKENIIKQIKKLE